MQTGGNIGNEDGNRTQLSTAMPSDQRAYAGRHEFFYLT